MYLGFDLGTHALKACALKLTTGGDVLRQLHAVDVVFARDLPAYDPPVYLDESTGSATSDPRLFLAALDLGFSKLRDAGCPLENVVAISGSAQMHGSKCSGWDAPHIATVRRLSTLDPRSYGVHCPYGSVS